VRHIRAAAALIRAAGLKAGAGPSGRGLHTPDLFVNWNYGRFGQELDELIIQTQTHLVPDSLNKNLNIPNYRSVALDR
jgi:hypothetical protein